MTPNPDPRHPSELPLTSVAPSVVLDTNVVLDWLLFGEPAVRALAEAVRSRDVRWLATPAMRDELAHVLGRGLAASRQIDPVGLLATWDAHVVTQPAAPPHRMSCTDPDDQKFLDLAFAAGACWLVSRDRALLKLGRRASPLGLAIVPPGRWRLAE